MALKKRQKSTKYANLSFSSAVVSLSILGTLWRTAIALAAGLIFVLFTIAQAAYVGMTFNDGVLLTNILSNSYIFNESLKGLLVFVLAFFLYDALYVLIANRYTMKDTTDRFLLLFIETLFIGGILISCAIQAAAISYDDWRAVAAAQNVISSVMVLTLLGALVLPAVRALVGVSWVMSKVQVRKKV